MPILAILQQPGSASLPIIVPAYRPVIFRVSATRTDDNRQPPVVYCDIYFEDFFYKSIRATQYDKINATNTEWKFDISDVCQEYLRVDLPVNGGTAIRNAVRQVVKCLVKFRSSGIDDGFIVPEGVAPVQGTATRTSISGTGTEAETFLVLNASLQHVDNQTLLTHLTYQVKNGTFGADCYPLSHRPSPYYQCKQDSDYFPFIYLGSKAFGAINVVYKLRQTPGSSSSSPTGTPSDCASAVTSVTAVVLDSLDTLISFLSSGAASLFDYNIDSGSWLAVPSNPFTLPLNALLTYLITEAGQPIITDDSGNIIVPESVHAFDTPHTLTIRPRCANGVYGTTGSTTFTIASSSVPGATSCTPAESFALNHIDNVARKIYLDILLPTGATDFRLQWRYNYGGGGFISSPVTEDHTLTASPFVWDIPASITTAGTFLLIIRTKCSTTSYSADSNEVDVPFAPVTNPDNLVVSTTVLDPQDTSSFMVIKVDVELQTAVADALNVTGWVQLDKNGTLESVAFGGVIPAGALNAEFSANTSNPGGGVVYTGVYKILSVSPNPTSDGKTIIF